VKPRTDYSAIAARYDGDRAMYTVGADPEVVAHGGTLVDVGCGTGTWLAAQRVPRAIGIDPSAAMLRHVVGLAVVGRAEALPLATASASWVESRYCFHHFDDERAFFREAHRVLADGGVLRLVNVMPLEDPDFTLYDFFPEARAVDERRWRRSDELVAWMKAEGFVDVTYSVASTTTRVAVDDYVAILRSRTISQLALIDDDAFARGVGRLAEMEGTITDSATVWTFRARR
jgi:SAM-dependent methyltransferase